MNRNILYALAFLLVLFAEATARAQASHVISPTFMQVTYASYIPDGIGGWTQGAGFLRAVKADGTLFFGPVSVYGQGGTSTSDPPSGLPGSIKTQSITWNYPSSHTEPYRIEIGYSYHYPNVGGIYVWTEWVGSVPAGSGLPNPRGLLDGSGNPIAGIRPAKKKPDENGPCATGKRDVENPDVGAKSGSDNASGSPLVSINPISGNMTVRDVPIWWDSPYGLDVTFALNFNSLDTENSIRPMGPGWVLNYGAYAIEDPSGEVIIVSGNGDRWTFTPKTGGGYDPPLNFPCILVETGAHAFQLTHLPTDTVYNYGCPTGVTTSVSLFLSAVDKSGVSVTMGHNSNGALTSVTHSIGGVWDIIYNSSGLVERIDDPFDRSAYFSYDALGALREVTDMGGLNYAFRYSNSANPVNATPASQMFMTEIIYAPDELSSAGDPNRTWYPQVYRFLTEPVDDSWQGMWTSFKITLTEPDGGTKIYDYDGAGKGSHRTSAQAAAGSPGSTYTYSLANAEFHVSDMSFASGGTASLGDFNPAGVPLTVSRRDGAVLEKTVNSFQQLLTVTDPTSRVTTLEYESNGFDVKEVVGPDSVTAVELNYDSNRLPIQILRRNGTKTVATYNGNGQLLTAKLYDDTNTLRHTTTYDYSPGHWLDSVDLDGRVIASYTYDEVGRAATITDEDGVTLEYTYDDLNRVTKITYPDDTSEEMAYHPITGMKDWAQARDGQRTLYFYDKRGYLVAARAPGQRFYYWGYDNDGNLTLLIDPKGNRTTWEYDVEGRMIKKTLQDNAVEQLAWNTKSQVTQHTSPRGMKSIFTYDTLGRLTSTAYQTSTGATAFPTESVTYDILDRVETSTDGEGTTTYTFDSTARLTDVDGPYGSDTVSYAYDALSRVNSITTPGSITQSFTFDSDDRLSTWTDVFGSGSMTYSGHTQRVTNISRAGGLLTTSFAYTAASDLFKLTQIKHESSSTTVSQFDYTWNAQQDLATWTRTLGSGSARETRWDLAHDAAHQLIGATLKQVSDSSVVADQRWGYDKIGNRALEHDLVTGVRTEYSHNNTNQLVDRKVYSSGQKPWVKGSLDEPGSVSLGGNAVPVKADNSFEGQAPSRTTTVIAKDSAGNATSENWQFNSGSGSTADSTLAYTHDSEGNLLGDGTSTFEWDLRNRLTAIVTGTHRTEFTYDGSDRRVRVVEKESGVTQSDLRYAFNGLTLLEERATDNSTVLRRFFGGGHVDVADSGKRYAYTTDHLGSVREVTLLDGTSGNPTTATLTARYDYDVWGKRVVLDGGGSAETLVLHGYTGHAYHRWSGLWLAPYRAYSSATACWISRDPIGESGGLNLYAYVHNRPLTAIDPLGWRWLSFFDPSEPPVMAASQYSGALYDSQMNNSGDEYGARAMADVQDLINALAQEVRQHGLLDGVTINDHGAPWAVGTGDDHAGDPVPNGQGAPNVYTPDEVAGIVGPFLKPGGTLEFNNCNIVGNFHADDHHGGGLNEKLDKKAQELADKHNLTIKAPSGDMEWHLGLPAWVYDPHVYKPKKQCE